MNKSVTLKGIKYHKLTIDNELCGLFQSNSEELIQGEIQYVLERLPAGTCVQEISKDEYFKLLVSRRERGYRCLKTPR